MTSPENPGPRPQPAAADRAGIPPSTSEATGSAAAAPRSGSAAEDAPATPRSGSAAEDAAATPRSGSAAEDAAAAPRPGSAAEGAPAAPRLGPAAEHLAAAESAAGSGDFDAAVRERFRAVVRGLEQGGVLEVRRARTAHETAAAAVAEVPDRAGELPGAARGFDEIVYGGRAATPEEYERLARADSFSHAPPPPPEPVEVAERERQPRRWRPPPLPELLRSPKFWAFVLAALAIALIAYLLLRLAAAPTAPPPQHVPSPGRPELPRPDPGEGSDSIFERLPARIAFGGLQLLICAAIVVWWRARRRGALVPEPRPVEVPAGELLAGQARLYRRSGDRDHVAAKLRAAALRRMRPTLGLAPDAPPDRVVTAVAARTGADPNVVGAALFGPVPDDRTLQTVVAQLDRIESEIG